MTIRKVIPLFLVAICLVAFAPHSLYAGLYDDDTKDVTSGDLADQDYWWAKFDSQMLELALKQKQPEGRIGLNLASSINRLNDLIKKYPKHEDLKKWKVRDEEIQKKIDPNGLALRLFQGRHAVGRIQLRPALGQLALCQNAPGCKEL